MSSCLHPAIVITTLMWIEFRGAMKEAYLLSSQVLDKNVATKFIDGKRLRNSWPYPGNHQWFIPSLGSRGRNDCNQGIMRIRYTSILGEKVRNSLLQMILISLSTSMIKQTSYQCAIIENNCLKVCSPTDIWCEHLYDRSPQHLSMWYGCIPNAVRSVDCRPAGILT